MSLLIQDVVSKACKELPEGFVISLCMENGAVYAEVTNPIGETVSFQLVEYSDSECIINSILDSLQAAKDDCKK